MQIIYKHCISLGVFLSLTIYFFNPVIFENKELKEELNDLRDGSDMFESDMDLNGDKPPDKPK